AGGHAGLTPSSPPPAPPSRAAIRARAATTTPGTTPGAASPPEGLPEGESWERPDASLRRGQRGSRPPPPRSPPATAAGGARGRRPTRGPALTRRRPGQGRVRRLNHLCRQTQPPGGASHAIHPARSRPAVDPVVARRPDRRGGPTAAPRVEGAAAGQR